MSLLRIGRREGLAGAVVALMACWAHSAEAQQPVSPQGNGLLGDYYNYPEGPNPPEPAFPPGTFPGSPIAPNANPITHFLQRLDATVDFPDFTATPPAGMNADHQDWGAVWNGFITIPTTGNYQFGVGSDDGARLWVNQNPLTTTPTVDNWILEGINNNPGGNKQSAVMMLNAGQVVPVRLEFFQHDGGVGCTLWWSTPTSGGYVVIPVFAAAATGGLTSPVPSGAPVLTATGVPGAAQINLSWTPSGTGTAPTGYMIFRATTAGAEGTTPIAVVNGATTYTDSTVAFGTQYFYIVQPTAYGGVLIGTPSNEVSCFPNPIAVAPSNLLVVENGGVGTITLTTAVAIPNATVVNLPIVVQNTTSAGPSFTVTSGAAGPGTNIAAVLTGNGVAGQQFQITVTGVDDMIANDPQTANINLGPTTSADAGFNGLTFPPVVCTQIESDTAGVILTPASGLQTTNGGTPVNFTVQLSSIPSANVTLNLSVSIPYEAVATGPGGLSTLTFTPANWNTPQTVTVTPQVVNAQVLYVSSYFVSFTPVQSTDPNYSGIATNSEFIFEPTTIPPLKHVWHCGLMGGDLVLALGLLLMGRRMVKRRKA